MSFISEFKAFAARGNVVDLAVGVMIGAAFGKIVESLVNDLFMPVIGMLVGGLDFSNYFVALSGQAGSTLVDARKAGAVLAYGNFLTVALNFVILALVIFVMVRLINKLKDAEPPAAAAPAPTSEDVLVLREIRDLLRQSR